MSGQHMGPEEAVRAFEILGAKTFCAMHWGTFKLTDEPLGEPPERTRRAWAERTRPGAKLHVPDVGETLAL
jgi:L-ascorbate metabolism protein UlaG (beta-lactamase superfamily)